MLSLSLTIVPGTTLQEAVYTCCRVSQKLGINVTAEFRSSYNFCIPIDVGPINSAHLMLQELTAWYSRDENTKHIGG